MPNIYAINLLRNKRFEERPDEFNIDYLNPVEVPTVVDAYNGVVREKILFSDNTKTYPLVKIVTEDVVINDKPAIQKKWFYAYHTPPLQKDETIEELQARFEFDEDSRIIPAKELIVTDLDGVVNTKEYTQEMRKRVAYIYDYLLVLAPDLDKLLASLNQPQIAVLSLNYLFKKYTSETLAWKTNINGTALTDALDNLVVENQEDGMLQGFLGMPTERSFKQVEGYENETVLSYLKLYIKNEYFKAD